MKRAESPEFLESIANSPRVRPYLGGSGEVRAGDTWARSVALQWEDGGVVFMQEAPGVYDAHLVFARKAKDTLQKCRKALDYIFGLGARRVIARVPAGYWHVRRIARAAGMTESGGVYAITAEQHKERAEWAGAQH